MRTAKVKVYLVYNISRQGALSFILYLLLFHVFLFFHHFYRPAMSLPDSDLSYVKNGTVFNAELASVSLSICMVMNVMFTTSHVITTSTSEIPDRPPSFALTKHALPRDKTIKYFNGIEIFAGLNSQFVTRKVHDID